MIKRHVVFTVVKKQLRYVNLDFIVVDHCFVVALVFDISTTDI